MVAEFTQYAVRSVLYESQPLQEFLELLSRQVPPRRLLVALPERRVRRADVHGQQDRREAEVLALRARAERDLVREVAHVRAHRGELREATGPLLRDERVHLHR